MWKSDIKKRLDHMYGEKMLYIAWNNKLVADRLLKALVDDEHEQAMQNY